MSQSSQNWIWGWHSVLACAEEFPELILEIQAEQDSRAELEKKFSKLNLKVKWVTTLPKLLADKRTQGVAALLKMFPFRFFQDFQDEFLEKLSKGGTQWALLDRIEDPRNFGAILRSAAAFGVSGVFVGQRNQAALSGVVAQASAGNLFRVPVIICNNLNRVFEVTKNLETPPNFAALDVDGLDLSQVIAKTGASESRVWVLGSEGRGLRDGLFDRCHERIKIPMCEGVESLNVSVAGAIAFYASRQNQILRKW